MVNEKLDTGMQHYTFLAWGGEAMPSGAILMNPKKTTQINFRIPIDLMEWLDEYAAYLTEIGGTPVARTQALLKLVWMSKPEEDQKMNHYKNIIKSGFTSVDEAMDWRMGASYIIAEILSNSKWSKEEEEKIYELLFEKFSTDTDARLVAIKLGRDVRNNYSFPVTSEGNATVGNRPKPRDIEIAIGLRLLSDVQRELPWKAFNMKPPGVSK